MWIFTPALGDWWRLKAIRVHPDEMEKLTGNVEELTQTAMRGEIRQIVDSPFLPEPLILHGPDAEEEVDAHITGMLRNASGLRCAPTRPGVAGVSDIKRAQRALGRHGHDPGPIDGQMGPRTEAALRAFQTEQGQAPPTGNSMRALSSGSPPRRRPERTGAQNYGLPATRLPEAHRRTHRYQPVDRVSAVPLSLSPRQRFGHHQSEKSKESTDERTK